MASPLAARQPEIRGRKHEVFGERIPEPRFLGTLSTFADACVLNSVHAINWRPIPQIDWQRVTGAGIAICSAGAEHDDYSVSWTCHRRMAEGCRSAARLR